PQRGEPAQRLADRRARDVELLRELLLAENGPWLELPGDDRLLDHERDVVGLGGVERHSSSLSLRPPARLVWISAWARNAFASSASFFALRRASSLREMPWPTARIGSSACRRTSYFSSVSVTQSLHSSASHSQRKSHDSLPSSGRSKRLTAFRTFRLTSARSAERLRLSTLEEAYAALSGYSLS